MASKHDARRNIENARDSMSEIAEELMRRSSPGYVKDRAKEAALKRSVEVKDRVAESPLAWKVIGGALGVGIASLLSRRYQTVELEDEVLEDYRWRASPDVYVGGYTEVVPVQSIALMDCGCDLGTHDLGLHDDQKHGLKAKVSGAASNLRERASDTGSRVSEKAADLKDRASSKLSDARDSARDAKDSARERISDVASSAREKLSSAKEGARDRVSGLRESVSERTHDLRDRAAHLRERAPELKGRAQASLKRGADEQPWAIALGAVALGALASFLLPVSETERRAFRPYREKAMDKVQGLKEEAVSRLETLKEGVTEQAKQALHGANAGAEGGFQASGSAGSEDTGSGASFRVSGSAEGGVHFEGSPRDSGSSYQASPESRDEAFRSPGLIEHKEGEAREAGSEVIGSYDPKVH